MTAATATPSQRFLFGRFRNSRLLPLLKFALLSAFREPRRALVALLTIMFGVLGLVLAGGFIEWNLWFGRESTIRSQLGHIRIYVPGYLEGGQADPYRYLLPGDSPDFALVEGISKVVTVAPRLGFAGLISHGEATLSFLGEGVDPQREGRLAQAVNIVAGQGLSELDSRGFLLGEGLADNLGVKVGDTVVLLANTQRGGVNAIEGTVRGLFRTITKAYDDGAIRIPLIAARRLLATAGSHHWAILLEDTDDTRRVTHELQEKLQGRAYQVVPWTELADFYNKTAALLGKQMALMQFLIGVIIILSIANTLMLSVMERTREIGTAMALGLTKADIRKQFLMEGVVIGVLGSLIGLVLGIILARVISNVGIPMPAAPGMSQGFTAEIMVTPWLGFQACAVAIGSCLLASTYPAWRASRMVIVDALRHGR